MSCACGIDFGTSNSVVAIAQDGSRATRHRPPQKQSGGEARGARQPHRHGKAGPLLPAPGKRCPRRAAPPGGGAAGGFHADHVPAGADRRGMELRRTARAGERRDGGGHRWGNSRLLRDPLPPRCTPRGALHGRCQDRRGRPRRSHHVEPSHPGFQPREPIRILGQDAEGARPYLRRALPLGQDPVSQGIAHVERSALHPERLDGQAGDRQTDGVDRE
jgi:hypothetical protein